MNTELFDYDLPPKYIAQKPAEPRDSSKLLVLKRNNGLEHKYFFDITGYLQKGDCLVINDTKVRPARLKGIKKSSSNQEIADPAKIEMLILNKKNNRWEALVKGLRRLKEGDEVTFKNFSVKIERIFSEGLVEISSKEDIEKKIPLSGKLPLPPYIKKYTGSENRYQTVYARKATSVAAPTAGLHFTDSLLQRIDQKGVKIVPVHLSVGWDTFKPVREKEVENHKIHSEAFSVSKETAEIINKTKREGKKVIAVGTTTARVLESAANNSFVRPLSGKTDLFIYPGYRFKIVNALITNFHLPESTLLMLVSAFYERKEILKAYEAAKRNKYRFFSFGDAMMII